MKISEQQLLKLIMIAKDSINYKQVLGGLGETDRNKLVGDILYQQSNEKFEVGEIGDIEEI